MLPWREVKGLHHVPRGGGSRHADNDPRVDAYRLRHRNCPNIDGLCPPAITRGHSIEGCSLLGTPPQTSSRAVTKPPPVRRLVPPFQPSPQDFSGALKALSRAPRTVFPHLRAMFRGTPRAASKWQCVMRFLFPTTCCNLFPPLDVHSGMGRQRGASP